MIPIEPDDCLAMRWPLSLGPEPSSVASEYTLRIEVNERDFKTVQKAIGFDVAEDDWAQLTHSLVAGLMVFAQVRDSHEAVAVSAAEQRASGIAELGWVAVAPAHRGRGLGSAICSELTRRLVDARQKIFLSTQDHRVEALRIYFALGFHPVFRPEKVDRWRLVSDRLAVAFAPEAWGWPS